MRIITCLMDDIGEVGDMSVRSDPVDIALYNFGSTSIAVCAKAFILAVIAEFSSDVLPVGCQPS